MRQHLDRQDSQSCRYRKGTITSGPSKPMPRSIRIRSFLNRSPGGTGSGRRSFAVIRRHSWWMEKSSTWNHSFSDRSKIR